MPTFVRPIKAIGIVLVFFALAAINTAANRHLPRDTEIAFDDDRKIISVQLTNYRSELQALVESGFAVAGVDYPNKIVDLYVDGRGSRVLKRSLKSTMRIVKELPVAPSAPDSGYKTPEEVATAMHAFAQDYPDITQLRSVGKSLEGRDIWAIKITRDAAVHDPAKPAVLFNAMHHAREVMTVEVTLDTIQYLLENYGQDEKVTHWVDSNVIWVVAMFNVDGNNRVWTDDNMWRKNTRDGHGVDINRNYPYNWNTCNGSSSNKYAQDYRGTAPASEPETNVLMNLVQEIRPVVNISYHSYSELVLYPYGCDGERTPTREVVEKLGSELSRKLPSDRGSGYYTPGTPWELLYAVDGGDMDWMYHEYNVVPFVIELNASGQGFQPPYSTWRDRTVTKLRAGWGYLLDRLDQSGVRGVVTDVQGNVVPGATVTIEKVNDKEIAKQTVPVNPDGSYHVILNPGNYRVVFSAQGRDPQEKNVTIGEVREELDIVL